MHNHITIHGYLGKDPELKEYRNSKGETRSLVNLSVGVSRDIGDETDWFDVTMFGKRAEVIDKFFQKGSQIVLTGRMQSNIVERDGQKRKYWNLIANDFDFCDSKDSPRGGNNRAANDVDDSWEQLDEDNPFNDIP